MATVGDRVAVRFPDNWGIEMIKGVVKYAPSMPGDYWVIIDDSDGSEITVQQFAYIFKYPA